MTAPLETPGAGAPDASDVADEDGYRGPARLTLSHDGDTVEIDVQVRLVGHVEPFDGRYRWYGRVAADPRLDALLDGRRASAHVDTGAGQAVGELSDVDPWGRYRLSGVSTPPFAVAGP